MKESSYRDRDYLFGKTMLTLRTKIGLTQVALAHILGVSRRAISDWEVGKSYPNTDHIKDLIDLAVRQHVFPAEAAVDEIRELWHASHQKVLLDELWLNQLLIQSGGETDQSLLSREELIPQLHSSTQTKGGIQMDWGEALTVPVFYGREWELEVLMGWIVEERCRVISVIGLGGIGKSALVVNLMHLSSENFKLVIWRSLRDLPDCDILLNNLLQAVAPHTLAEANTDLDHRQSTLLEYMRNNRVLLVLDNLESVMEEGESSGRFIPGYEDLGRFLHMSAQTEHQSCILLTSREKPVDLIMLEGSQSPVRTLRIARLDSTACEMLLEEKGVNGNTEERARLIDMYAGNPLALKIVAQTIVALFAGELSPFLEQGEAIFGGIRELLDEQFGRLSVLEQRVLLWLTILREPATLNEILALMVTPVPRATLLETLAALRRRSLIERGLKQGSFALQSVVLEYMTARLIAEASTELQTGKLKHLINHGLELATVNEYVRRAQRRFLVSPLLTRIGSMLSSSQVDLEKHFLMLLDELRTQTVYAQGYGPANILALLREKRGQLQGLDLTDLVIRGAYLQGIEMQDANLTGATLHDTIFTGSFDTIWAVAVSRTGLYWGVGSGQGRVYVWRKDGKILQLAWSAHGGTVWSLAFSPDESRLATSSWDGSVKLWDVENGSLVWMNWHTNNDVHCLAFSPDGHVLASGGDDGAVRLWDALSGAHLQTLIGHNSPVHSLAWDPDGTLLASGSFDGGIRIWEKPWIEREPIVKLLEGHPHWVTGLAFAPDGRTLASGSFDGTLRLWNTESLELLNTLSGHTGPVLSIDWSPNGSLIASSSFDQTIRLWDLEKLNTGMVLHGHGAAVYNIVFTPDNRSLLSSGDDGTLRQWDIERGQCVQIMQGHAASLYDIAWNPDSTQLVSASSDTLVTIWDVSENAHPKALSGHFWIVLGAAWSPDGRLLASAAWDNTVRIWDATTGAALQAFQQPDHPDNGFQCVAWSPDGKFLASGSYLWGLHVWNVTTGTLHWIGREQSTRIRRVAWSPDGTQLASCGDDGSVFLWDARDGRVQASLQGHDGMVMSVIWCPDGTKLASGGGSKGIGDIFLWDISSREPIQTWSIPGSILYSLAWSPDGEKLLSGGSDGMIRWWDIESGECMRVFKGHLGTVQSLKVSPDGRMLASSGDDNAIQLWDFQRGEHIRTLRRDRPYERLIITGIKGLTEAQKATLRLLGAIEEEISQ